MRRFSQAFMMTSLGAVVFALLLVGCGKKVDDDDEDGAPRKPKRSTGAAAAAPTLKPIQAKEYGTITGKITWEGDAPSIEEMTTALQKEIAAVPDHSYCLKGKLPGEAAEREPKLQPYETVEQEYRIGKNKGLGNVFVWIEPEKGYHFVIPADQLAAIDKEVLLTQPHCSFMPHCVVVFPSFYKDGDQVKTDQTLFLENDALVTHNAKVTGGPLNGESNSTLQPRKPDGTTSKLEKVFKPEKNPITVACDIHKWMRSYVRAHDHPYATVSSVGGDPKKKVWENLDSDAVGTYTIKGVPVGAKVKLFVWHEKAKGNYLNKGGAAGESITLAKENPKNFSATK